MSAERHVRDLSVRSMLLETLIERRARETPPATTALKMFEAKVTSVLTSPCELCRRHETEKALVLSTLANEGLAYLGSADDPALRPLILFMNSFVGMTLPITPCRQRTHGTKKITDLVRGHMGPKRSPT